MRAVAFSPSSTSTSAPPDSWGTACPRTERNSRLPRGTCRRHADGADGLNLGIQERPSGATEAMRGRLRASTVPPRDTVTGTFHSAPTPLLLRSLPYSTDDSSTPPTTPRPLQGHHKPEGAAHPDGALQLDAATERSSGA